MSDSFLRGTTELALVLFVDPDADSRFAYHAVASSAGFRVELAKNEREAITLANLMLPELVVLDVQLSEGDGLRTLRRLRTDARTGGIPVVTMSTDESMSLRAAVHVMKSSAHLTKPFTSDVLLRFLRRFAGAGRIGESPSAGPARSGASRSARQGMSAT